MEQQTKSLGQCHLDAQFRNKWDDTRLTAIF